MRAPHEGFFHGSLTLQRKVDAKPSPKTGTGSATVGVEDHEDEGRAVPVPVFGRRLERDRQKGGQAPSGHAGESLERSLLSEPVPLFDST